MTSNQSFRRHFYSFVALLLMGCGGFFLYKDKEAAGLAVFGAGASMMALQQSEDNKIRKVSTNESVDGITSRRIEELQKNNTQYRSIIELKNNQIANLKEENTELKIQKAKLETDLKYTDDPYYMKAKLERLALPESSLEEFNNSLDQTDEAEYDELEIEEEDNGESYK